MTREPQPQTSSSEWPKVSASAPTRVDLAGGTLDLWPVPHVLQSLCAQALPQPRTINAAVELFTSAEVASFPSPEPACKLGIDDGREHNTFCLPQELEPFHQSFPLVAQAWAGFKEASAGTTGRHWQITTRSEVPRGSGLGGSSSLFVSLLGALHHHITQPVTPALSEPELFELCHHACNLEAGLLGGLAGSQDHLAAAFGGVSSFRFGSHHTTRRTFSETCSEWLEKNTVLVLAPETHHSGGANWRTVKRFLEGDPQIRGLFVELSQNAASLEKSFQEEDFLEAANCITRDWMLRKKTVPELSTPSLDHIERIAKLNGAMGVKVCGAAEGGMALAVFESPLHQHPNFLSAVKDAGYEHLKVKIAQRGLRVRTSS